MRAVWPSLLSLLLGLAACDDMANQPKRLPFEAHQGEERPAAHRLPPDGTVARDDAPAPKPPPVTEVLLARGQERFDIYCAPCHGRTGSGDGMVVRRGFRRPESYHTDRLRAEPAGHFVDVMLNGFGAMPDFADRIDARDRWAIAAYIRALQLSEHATIGDVPANERGALRQ
jgi:mono/diheme cytochrome c family protein